MDSYDILVIILSVTLFIFLLLGIVCLILLAKVLQKVRDASENARAAAAHVEELTSQLTNLGKFSAMSSVISGVVKHFKKREK